MRTEPIPVPDTPRLAREAERWRGSPRPASIEPCGPGEVSVWDFPRPPALERVLEDVEVELGGVIVARTTAALRVCETASPPTYYLPGADVRTELLRPSAARGSVCEWKGLASYYDLVVGERVSEAAAWWYPRVNSEYQALDGHIAFYASRVDGCRIAGVAVVPQPGRFYAGWITPELRGPFKGGPGSTGW